MSPISTIKRIYPQQLRRNGNSIFPLIFLVSLGFKIDEASQKRFEKALTDFGKAPSMKPN
jgi:hypothetical protein